MSQESLCFCKVWYLTVPTENILLLGIGGFNFFLILIILSYSYPFSTFLKINKLHSFFFVLILGEFKTERGIDTNPGEGQGWWKN